MFSKFPKIRPPLPPQHMAIYEEYYASNRAGDQAATGMAQKLEGWMHRAVAQRGAAVKPHHSVLEMGCGNLNHLPYESGYGSYDAVEPFKSLYEGSDAQSQISAFYDSVHDISGKLYDRIISVAVLEHLTDLPRDVSRCAKLMAQGGVFQAGVPCEGEAAWWLGWNASTGLAFRKQYGLDYGVLMRHEHVNSLAEIVAVVEHVFADVSIKRSPFPAPLPHMSFYAYIEARQPDLDRIDAILNQDRS